MSSRASVAATPSPFFLPFASRASETTPMSSKISALGASVRSSKVWCHVHSCQHETVTSLRKLRLTPSSTARTASSYCAGHCTPKQMPNNVSICSIDQTILSFGENTACHSSSRLKSRFLVLTLTSTLTSELPRPETLSDLSDLFL